jgi:hypothetical protein
MLAFVATCVLSWLLVLIAFAVGMSFAGPGRTHALALPDAVLLTVFLQTLFPWLVVPGLVPPLIPRIPWWTRPVLALALGLVLGLVYFHLGGSGAL